MSGRPLSIYIHIPFCLSACHYCSFPRIISSDASLLDAYVGALERSIAATPEQIRNRTVTTIYIGGGTPSLLTDTQLTSILHAVQTTFSCSAEEITLECNPEDVTAARQIFSAAGVNRISLGAQTFQDPGRLGRRHSSAQVQVAVDRIRAAGISNISLDLIFGLPGSDLTQLTADIEAAVALTPQHISFYGLSVDPGTILSRDVECGRRTVPGEAAWLEQMYRGWELLEAAGYHRYEISNFAQPGFESRHNLTYWRGGDYLGFGSGAASRLGALRWYAPFGPENYIRLSFPVWEEVPPEAVDVERLSATDLLKESIMTRLRLRHGMPLNELTQVELIAAVEEWAQEGMLDVSGGHVMLSPKGVAFSDTIFASLFATLDP